MANYIFFKDNIEEAEGGYQNLKSDAGNKNSLGEYVGTNFGVSARFYEDIIGRPPTVADMKAITQDKAHSLFKIYFWDVVYGDRINSQKIAETLTDHAINAGTGSAVKVMQETLNNYFGTSLAVDGGMGNLTLTAINSIAKDAISEEDLFIVFSQQRFLDYNTKPTCDSFCPIWHDRVEDIADHYNIDLEEKIEPVSQLASKKKSSNPICGCGYFGYCYCKNKK